MILGTPAKPRQGTEANQAQRSRVQKLQLRHQGTGAKQVKESIQPQIIAY
ncbi:hypothetical protein HYD56_03865 [Mycoplasmopsis bovis]|nr:hypothetical protein [Mycoplasmopsis bovis]QQH66710.1 hypothetical protein HYD56_03865 [Mycoplasmopsis bovis]